MARDTKGQAVRDYGAKKIDTKSEDDNKGTKSRVAEPKEGKAKQHVKDSEGPGSPKSVASDTDNNPDARKNPEAFDQHIERVQQHHDRLAVIEKHLGLHHWGDDMKSQDQKAMGGPRATSGEHITEKRGTPSYGRKRH